MVKNYIAAHKGSKEPLINSDKMMGNDDLVLIQTCYVLHGIVLLLLALSTKQKLTVILTNLGFSVCYSSILFYNLTYNSKYRSGLIWIVALLLIIPLHILVNLVQLVLILIKKKKA